MFIQTIDGETKKFYFTTKLSDNIEVLPNGFLRCNNVIMGRTGTQKYSTKELGIQTTDGKNYIIDVNRYEEDVFNPDTLKSIEGMSITIGHPKDKDGKIIFVTSKNVDNLSVGTILNVRRDGDNLVGDIIIDDENAIKKVVDKEIRELSLGYDTKYELDGEDALKQTNIVVNHLALVEKGRAGNARIVDEANQEILDKGDKVLEKETLVTKLLKVLGIKKAVLDDDTELEVKDEVVEPVVSQPAVEEPVVATGDDGKSVRQTVEVNTYENEYHKETTVTKVETVSEYHEKTQEEIEKEKKEKEEKGKVIMITLDEAMKKIADLEPLKGTEAYEVGIKTVDAQMVEAGLGSIIKKGTTVDIFNTVKPTTQTVDETPVAFKAKNFLDGIGAVYNQFTPRELDKVSKNPLERQARIKELSSVSTTDLIK